MRACFAHAGRPHFLFGPNGINFASTGGTTFNQIFNPSKCLQLENLVKTGQEHSPLRLIPQAEYFKRTNSSKLFHFPSFFLQWATILAVIHSLSKKFPDKNSKTHTTVDIFY